MNLSVYKFQVSPVELRIALILINGNCNLGTNSPYEKGQSIVYNLQLNCGFCGGSIVIFP